MAHTVEIEKRDEHKIGKFTAWTLIKIKKKLSKTEKHKDAKRLAISDTVIAEGRMCL